MESLYHFAAHCDYNPAMAGFLTTMHPHLRKKRWLSTPNDVAADLDSGTAPAVDEGNLYVTTGNSLNETGPAATIIL
jgi:hypothetical protein